MKNAVYIIISVNQIDLEQYYLSPAYTDRAKAEQMCRIMNEEEMDSYTYHVETIPVSNEKV